MSDTKPPLRVLFCMGVNQNFMDGTADEMKDVWAAFVAMMQGIARLLPEGHDVRPLLAEIAQETTTPTPVFLWIIRLLPLLTLGSLLAARRLWR